MSEIQKLTDAIRIYSESDLCYGTLVTLKKIDHEAMRLEIALTEAQAEIERLKGECSFCGTGDNAHHSAECIDDQAKKDKLIEQMREALESAEQFVVNGVETGYIQIPDKTTLDKAHETLPRIKAALEAAERGK